MTPKGFIAGCFLLGGLGLIVMLGLRGNLIGGAIGVLAALYGGITLFRMRLRKIDVTK
jgi:hypothetical protein